MALENFTIKPLEPITWPDFARLVEKHNGVWGGCWCVCFHQKGTGSREGNRTAKHEMVCNGTTRTALVYDGEVAVGWCQFGRPEELPRIYHKKAYAEIATGKADWRITCFFVDRSYRKRGVARRALEGALELIAAEGGGLVESFPAEARGRKTSSSFLYNATLSIFEAAGFTTLGRLGMHHWLVTKVVQSAE